MGQIVRMDPQEWRLNGGMEGERDKEKDEGETLIREKSDKKKRNGISGDERETKRKID